MFFFFSNLTFLKKNRANIHNNIKIKFIQITIMTGQKNPDLKNQTDFNLKKWHRIQTKIG